MGTVVSNTWSRASSASSSVGRPISTSPGPGALLEPSSDVDPVAGREALFGAGAGDDFAGHQSSGTSQVWNIWIIYPVIGLGFAVAIDAWNTYGRQQISESEIRREMDRLARR